jgi:modulator of FtsH protease HflK
MPWQNNNDGSNGGSGGKNPWGGGSGGGSGDGSGDRDGGSSNPWSSGSGGPRNPWGDRGRGGGGGRGPFGGGGGNRPPNFDDLFRKGSEQFKSALPGGAGNKFWLMALLGLIAIWIFSTSVFRVNADEIGVVQTFGKYSREVPPGLGFKLPDPIETVTKPRVTEVRTIVIGGESQNENLVLTGDQNIVDIAYEVRWKIKGSAVYDFLFRLKDPEATIREVAESAMREAVSAARLNDAIGQQRAQIATNVQRRVQEVLDSYRAGVDVVGVFFRQVDPPAAVDQAFKDVSAAQQDAQRFLNQANAYSQALVANAQGQAARFNAVYLQYRAAPDVTRKRIYLETMESVLKDMNKVVVDSNGVVPYLPLPQLEQRRAAAAQQQPSQ